MSSGLRTHKVLHSIRSVKGSVTFGFTLPFLKGNHQTFPDVDITVVVLLLRLILQLNWTNTISRLNVRSTCYYYYRIQTADTGDSQEASVVKYRSPYKHKTT